jgi:cysteine desulfurase family protein (TIGR01976 family)
MPIDPVDVRSHFPALQRRLPGGRVAYFDGPGGTQVPYQVAAAVFDYLVRHNGNTHWAFATSLETEVIVENARRGVADLLGCTAQEVVFGPNMSTLTFHLARAIGRSLKPGDEIVVTDLDHHANIDPWRALELDYGIRTRAVGFDTASGRLSLEELEQNLGPRTRLVAVGGASNALGTINDLEAVIERARAAGALVFVDAVHLVPHQPIDVRRLGCDFLAWSAYKCYGPHIGILYGRCDRLAEWNVPKLQPAPDEVPDRWETGTPVFEGIAGVGGMIEWLDSLASSTEAPDRSHRLGLVLERFHRHGEHLVGRLWKGLEAIPEVRLWGPTPGSGPRTPTVAFTLADRPSRGVAEELARRALFLSDGDFYARTTVQRLGLRAQGLLRAGCMAYTTEQEVDRLIEAVGEIADDLG